MSEPAEPATASAGSTCGSAAVSSARCTTVTSCGGSATSGAESSATTTGSSPVPCLPVLSAISCSAQSAKPLSPEPWSTSTSLLRSGLVAAIAAPSRSPGFASSSVASRSETDSASSSSRPRSAPARPLGTRPNAVSAE